MKQFIAYFLFALAGFLIMYGLKKQTQSILVSGRGMSGMKKISSLLIKFSGFVVLAFSILEYKADGLWFKLGIFFISAIATISYFLLARRSSIR